MKSSAESDMLSKTFTAWFAEKYKQSVSHHSVEKV